MHSYPVCGYIFESLHVDRKQVVEEFQNCAGGHHICIQEYVNSVVWEKCCSARQRMVRSRTATKWQFSKGTLLRGMSQETFWQLACYSSLELALGFEVLFSSECSKLVFATLSFSSDKDKTFAGRLSLLSSK